MPFGRPSKAFLDSRNHNNDNDKLLINLIKSLIADN